ncbi:MAG: hypothetical protein J1E77_03520 [Prevotella sp.]|nr:hypothetical protein [Prevotella sp.]
MKKIVCLAQLAMAVLVFASCGSSKKLPQASKAEMENPYGTKLELTESERYAMEAPEKRASGKGVSASESVARQLAEDNARTALSKAIDVAVQNATRTMVVRINQYAGGDTDGMNATDEGQQNDLNNMTFSSNIIANTKVVKLEKFYGKNRQYTIFVCLEYDGSIEDITRKLAEKAMPTLQQRVPDSAREKMQSYFKDFQQVIENELKKGAAQ